MSKCLVVLHHFLKGSGRVCKKLQYPSCYVSLTLGVILMFYSFQWLQNVENQEATILRGLVSLDKLFNNTVEGMNTFLEKAPAEVTEFFDNVTVQVEEMINLILGITGDVASKVQFATQSMAGDTLNSVLSMFHVPHRLENVVLTLNFKIEPRWRPDIPKVDLREFFIPSLPFSAQRTLYPPIHEVGKIARSFCFCVFLLGLVVFLFGAIPLVIAFFSPWVPHCLVPEKIVAKVTWSIIKIISKKRVWIPLVAGILLFVSGLSLGFLVNKAEAAIEKPLLDADKEIEELIHKFNEFNSKMTQHLMKFVDDNGQTIDAEAKRVTRLAMTGISDTLYFFSLVMEQNYNNVRNSMGIASKTYVTNVNLPADLPSFVPRFPMFDTSNLEIPLDAISLRDLLFPLAQQSLKGAKNASRNLCWMGLLLCVIPVLTIVCHAAKPCIPKKIMDWWKDCEVVDKGDDSNTVECKEITGDSRSISQVQIDFHSRNKSPTFLNVPGIGVPVYPAVENRHGTR